MIYAGRLRIGINTPILVQTPGGHARWERAATVDDLRRVVVTADELGYHHLTCSEHFALPETESPARGNVYWDALSTLSWAAAITNRIQLVTNVVVLGYHHPLEILKQYGTLDRLSAGRLILGVGVGSLRAEFDQVGAPFEDRGARADEALAAILGGWGKPVVAFSGSYFGYENLAVEPHAISTRPVIWVGGRTARSLRRAIQFGQAWTPFAVPHDQLKPMLAKAGAPDGFDIVIGPLRALDPLGDPDGTRVALDALVAAGVTGLHATFRSDSVEGYLGQLEALAALVV